MRIRVLVVDDHEPWRRLVISELLKKPGCEIVGEVDDGLEAVDSAVRLAPDVILLDIALPSLTGIEVARRILAAVPDSRILFLSAHISPAIVEAALAAGARGYVVKMDAGQELQVAIDAIMQERQFISARLGGLPTR
jgi:DNA-binding NarL/FixJ family response regulator